jgi:hypothetical protein
MATRDSAALVNGVSDIDVAERAADLADGNDVSATTIRRWTDEVIALLAAKAPRLDRALKKIAQAGGEVVLLDGTLIRTRRRSGRANRKNYRTTSPTAPWPNTRPSSTPSPPGRGPRPRQHHRAVAARPPRRLRRAFVRVGVRLPPHAPCFILFSLLNPLILHVSV